MAILFGPWAHGADTNQQGSSVVEGAWGYVWGQNGGLYRKVFVTAAATTDSAAVGVPVYGMNTAATFPLPGACVVGVAGTASNTDFNASRCLGFLAHTISGNAMALLHCAGPGVVMVRAGTAATDSVTVFAGNVISYVNNSVQYGVGTGASSAPFSTFDAAAGMYARAMHTGTAHAVAGNSVLTLSGGTSNSGTVNAFIMCGHWPPGHF